MLEKYMHLGCFKGLGIAISFAAAPWAIAYPRCATLIAQVLTYQFAATIIFFANCAIAQITPDGTLPNNSNVKLEGNTRIIEGGTQAGSNLFHSFSEFSVPTNSTALFNNAADIQNIMSRVTGNSISNIDGLIRANGTTNLFLINPNGIIFGQNARLDIRGSFFATSANSMKFASGFEFSAENPQPTPLLTISTPIGLQFGANPGLIQIQGNGQGARGVDSLIIDTQNALRVQPDKTLALVGGDINLEGATLKTAGGRIELGSVAGNSLVNLTPTNFGFALSYGSGQNFGNIQLSQQATVDASGEGGGDIQVQGRRVTVTNGSRIQTSTLGAKQGGNLDVQAQTVQLIGGKLSAIAESIGDAGNLTIKTRELLVQDGAQVSTVTFSAGKGGSLSIDAQDVQLIGTTATATGLSTSAQPNSTGDAGSLTIKTNTLLVRDGAQVSAFTSGAGKGGSLSVDAQDVQLIGTTADGRFPSGFAASVEENLTGDAGSLKIKTNTLLVRDGAQVSTGTFGAGKGGSLSIDAQDVQLIGRSANNRLPSLLAASVQPNSAGNAGDLTIKTNTLLVRNGAEVSTDTFGAGKGGNLNIDAQNVQLIGISANNRSPTSLGASAKPNSTGDAGSLTIKTNTLLVRDGAEVSTDTFGTGKGGNLNIDAQNVQLIGISANNRFSSSLRASAQPNSTGDAGSLTIKTNTLLVRDGAQVSTFTSSAGKGGSLSVDAQDIQLIGRSANNRLPSVLAASTLPNSTGDAGSLTIKTNTLLVRDGAAVLTTTLGSGKGGSLSVDAQDVQLIGRSVDNQFSSGLGASAMLNSTGDAGSLTIKTNTLLVQDGAGVYVESSGTGTAGIMTLNARSIRLNNLALLTASTQSAKVDPNREQATININSQNLIMRRNSNIASNATGENVIGGNINIDTDTLAVFENSRISANSTDSRGGRVTIKTEGIFPAAFRDYITATGATPDLSGTLQINTPDIDPSKGLVPLTIDVVDVARLVDSNICARTANSSFNYTGRGGLPASPNNTLSNDAVWEDWRLTAVPRGRKVERDRGNSEPPLGIRGQGGENNFSRPTQVMEAQGWIINKHGEVTLTAYAPTATPYKVGSSSFGCQPPIAK